MTRDLGKLRRSTLAMTNGPGSIVDFRVGDAAVSAVVMGLETWDSSFPRAGLANDQKISEMRLERRLGVRGFRLPPVADEGKDEEGRERDTRSLLANRFPGWLQCPRCNRIAFWDEWSADEGLASMAMFCSECTQDSGSERKVYVIPVRFIMACENGHLEDFPWHDWVRHADDCPHTDEFLRLEAKRAGLSGIEVSCEHCGASRSLDGIFRKQTAREENWKCHGNRPWLGDWENCNLRPTVLQRGASNLYFPVTRSALSIPPWTDPVVVELGIHYQMITDTDPSERPGFIKQLVKLYALDEGIFSRLGMSAEQISDWIEDHRGALVTSNDPDSIRPEEYQQFIAGTCAHHHTDHEFEIRPIEMPRSLRPYFITIVRAVRLREVRAILGFTRINPHENDAGLDYAHLSRKRLDWLPAIEVRGEGIFLALNPETIADWEQQDTVIHRADRVNRTLQSEWRIRYPDAKSPRVITPRFLLVHTLAHALMRQLTLDCGYSSASLRERLYVSDGADGMAGLLIYTSTSDADGTLGGLERQGLPQRIERTVKSAIRAMEWCSSDPLCIQGTLVASQSYSVSACHACVLAPETSCEESNRFLDRGALVGTPDSKAIGYFSSLLRRE